MDQRKPLKRKREEENINSLTKVAIQNLRDEHVKTLHDLKRCYYAYKHFTYDSMISFIVHENFKNIPNSKEIEEKFILNVHESIVMVLDKIIKLSAIIDDLNEQLKNE